MTISTHVLDAALGRPAEGVPVRLERGGEVLAEGRTGADGRITGWPSPEVGVHRLVFDTGGVSEFFPEVVLSFRVTDPEAHHHVPLLLSPFAYSTYRGS
ncbi:MULTISPECIES: hydroxyisourate hydrolase [Actinosynnema]|uniref:hydroxyisourate hydrolase n=1 Tax=Actinosynnema TaxID=40566 RepID=UPI0020A4C5AA|nr:hydroxyisourate hydrolase [Actinosynnema pretiosum]MCP2097235.1 5-hydroxyisourate hydrolase [Actinosynnema pretiosum]